MLQIDVDQGEFDAAVRRFLADALPGGKGDRPVNSRADSEKVKVYAQSLNTDGVAPTTRTSPTTPDPGASVPAGKTAARNAMHPDKRSRVIPSDFKVSTKKKLLVRIFEELRTIDPDRWSFAAAYLLRAFVEQTVNLYARKYSLGHEGQLHEVVRRCIPHLESVGADKKRVLKVLQEMSNDKHSRISPDGLGAWVHGASIPTATELKRRWDTLEDSLRVMVSAL